MSVFIDPVIAHAAALSHVWRSLDNRLPRGSRCFCPLKKLFVLGLLSFCFVVADTSTAPLKAHPPQVIESDSVTQRSAATEKSASTEEAAQGTKEGLGQIAVGPGEGKDSPSPTLEQWVQQLGHENYLRRERASRHLIKAGPAAVEALSKAVRSGDLEVVERAAAAMIEIAISVPPRDDGGAYERLLELSSQSVGRPASMARNALAEVKDFRSQQAKKSLSRAGVFVGLAEFSIGAQSRQRMLVEVGDNWNEDVSALQWLEWVDGYDNARVEGQAVTLEVMREVVKMPSLRSLILADAEIRDDALDPLSELSRLDTLEFQYSRLEESQGDLIAALPLRTSLILMGTGLSEQRAEKLKEELPGLQIQYRRGGFLGVMCIDNFDVCEITGIQEGSAAEAAGLMRGDIITMIDDREIKHFRDLQNAINEHVPGDSVEVQYQRGGEDQSLSLKLRRYQES